MAKKKKKLLKGKRKKQSRKVVQAQAPRTTSLGQSPNFNIKKYVDGLFKKVPKKKLGRYMRASRQIRQNEDMPRRERLSRQMTYNGALLNTAQRMNGINPTPLRAGQIQQTVNNMSPYQFNNSWNSMYVPITFNPITNFNNLQETYEHMLKLNLI